MIEVDQSEGGIATRRIEANPEWDAKIQGSVRLLNDRPGHRMAAALCRETIAAGESVLVFCATRQVR